MSIRIAKAKAEDAEAVLAFSRICGAETDNLSFGAEGLPVSIEQEAAFLSSVENSDTGAFFVARDGEEVVGTASYSVFPGTRMAHRGEFGLSVRQSHWNRGIGTLLLQHILDFAKDTAKSGIVTLEVRSDNEAAIHLYEKFGFVRTGTIRGYFKIDGQLVDFDSMELIFE